MKNINWRKYTFAVYLLILAMAIILALIGINYYPNGNSYQTLLLNIATELAGAVLIYILVKQVFSLDDDQKERLEHLEERIRLLQTEINTRFSSFVPQEILGTRFHFGRLLPEAESVILLGYTHSGLLRTYKKEITEAIKNGVKFRVLLITVDGDTGKLIKSHSSADKFRRFKLFYNGSINFLKEIQLDSGKKNAKNLELRITNWIPSCELIFVMTKSNMPNFVRVRLQPLSFRAGASLSSSVLVLNSHENEEDFNYFLNQFESLWKNDSRVSDAA